MDGWPHDPPRYITSRRFTRLASPLHAWPALYLSGRPSGWRAMTPRCISRRAGPPWRVAAAPRAAPIRGRIMTRPAWPPRAPSVVSRLRLPRRLHGWLRRYLPAELSGTVSALLAAQL